MLIEWMRRWGEGFGDRETADIVEDYTAGRGAEEVQLLISRPGHRSVYGPMMF